MRLRLYGQRIAIQEVKEELEGSILLPETRTKSFYLGRVTAVGDGVDREGKKEPVFFNVGDLVMFQLLGVQDKVSQFVHDGEKVRILQQGDVIARLKATKVSLENFEIAGNWVLLKVDVETGTTLVLPDTARSPDMFTFTVEQKGAGVQYDFEKGETVYPERMRCNPIEIDSVAYAFVQKDDIHGVAKAA